MDNGVDQDLEDDSGTIAETPLGGKEFRGTVEETDPSAPKLTPAPEGVPEQFWDPLKGEMRTDALLKSYSELRKKMDAKDDDDVEADKSEDDADKVADDDADKGADDESDADKSEDDDADKSEDDEQKDAPELATAIEDARNVYAETGDLPDEAREPLRKAGITDEQIDFYLAGVKATEAALHQAAYSAAGSEEDLKAAMDWAASGGLTEKQIIAFNAQMGDVDTIKVAVPGLMAAFRTANPGEGRLTNRTTGHSMGDVYGSMDEFTQDLDRADKLRDKVARKKAIDKLARSRAAGTVKSERRSPFGGR